MNISDLLKQAAEKVSQRPYEGDEDFSLSCKVTTSMLRDLDAVAAYGEVTRSDALRALLSESLPPLVELCRSLGPNARGRTIIDSLPRYSVALNLDEQAEVWAFQEQR